jgi:hypothetical protein
MERTVRKGQLDAQIGDQVFFDLDYAADVALFAEMLQVLLLSLDFMQSDVKHVRP